MSQPKSSSIRILIIAKDLRRFQKAAQFLTRRGWPTDAVDSMKKAVEFVVKYRPTFVLVSMSHNNPNILKLPSLLQQTFNAQSIAFSEDMGVKSMQRLNSCKLKYVFHGHMSGPSLHVRIKKIILDQEREEKNKKRKLEAMSLAQDQLGSSQEGQGEGLNPLPGDNTPMEEDDGENYWGKKEKFGSDADGDYVDYEAQKKNKFGGSEQDPQSHGHQSSGPNYEDVGSYEHSQGGANSESEGAYGGEIGGTSSEGVGPYGSQSGSSEQDPQSHGYQPSGSNHEGAGAYGSQPEGSGFEGTGPYSHGQSGGFEQDSQSHGYQPNDSNFEGADSQGYQPQPEGSSHEGAGPYEHSQGDLSSEGGGFFGSQGDYNLDDTGPSGHGQQGSFEQDPQSHGYQPSGYEEQENSRGNALEKSIEESVATGSALLDSFGGGESSSFEQNQESDESVLGNKRKASKNSQAKAAKEIQTDFNEVDFDSEDPFVNTGNMFFDPVKEGMDVQSGQSFTIPPALKEDPDFSLSDSGELLEEDEGFDGECEVQFKEGLSPDKELKAIATLMDSGFREVCQPGQEEPKALEKLSSLGIIAVESANKEGYIIIALPDGCEDTDGFLKEVRKSMQKQRGTSDINLRLQAEFYTKIDLVEFIKWAENVAEFVSTLQHLDMQVAMAFIEAKNLPKIKKYKGRDDMRTVSVESLLADIPVNYTGYIHMKANDKMIQYIKSGRSISAKQKDRLKEKNVEEIFIPASDVEAFRSHHAACFLNGLIKRYKENLQNLLGKSA